MPAALSEKIAAGEIKTGQALHKSLADLKELKFAGLGGLGKPSPLAPLEAVAEQFKDGRWGNALLAFTDIISKFVEVEKEFAGKAFDTATKRVKSKAASVAEARNTVLSHAQLERRTMLVYSLMSQLSTLPQRCNVSDFTPYPREFPAVLKKLSGLQVSGPRVGKGRTAQVGVTIPLLGLSAVFSGALKGGCVGRELSTQQTDTSVPHRNHKLSVLKAPPCSGLILLSMVCLQIAQGVTC